MIYFKPSILLIITCLLFVVEQGKAQQVSQFSQYLNDNYLINPAASELSPGFSLQVSYRQQQNQVLRATDSYYISAFKTISTISPKQFTNNNFRLTNRQQNSTVSAYNAKMVHVAGGIISRDNFGLVERTTAHGNYGIHLPLNKRYTLSTAASIGYVGLNVSDQYYVLNENDRPFQNFIDGFSNASFMDLALGVWLYSDQLQLGYSIERLFSGNSLSDGDDETFNISIQHFISAGYKIDFSKWSVITSALHRINHQNGQGTDLSLKAIYKNKLWLGGSLRNQDVSVFHLGFRVNTSLDFNYTYDHSSRNQQGFQMANEISLKLRL